MTDPTEITIEPGEQEKVIEDADVGSVPYIVEVKDAPVRFAHKKRQADRGATLSAGQTHTLSDFRGSGIWLAAPEETATVRVRPAGASLESQPSREVDVVEGNIEVSADNRGSVSRQTVTGSEDFQSEIVPDGFSVLFRANPANSNTVEIDGFPLEPGDGIGLAVTSPGVVSVQAESETDETHAIYEVD